MRSEQRIYCLEGHWNTDEWDIKECHWRIEPTVEPMLQQIQRLGIWNYARRDCATSEELSYFLDREWHQCKYGSVLFFAAHGSTGSLYFSDNFSLDLESLAVRLEDRCEHCLVHFSSCAVMDIDEKRLVKFLLRTKAMGISGFAANEVGWVTAVDRRGNQTAPSLALELLLLSTIRTENINLCNGKSFNCLKKVREDLRQRFPDCDYRLMLRTEIPKT